MHTLLVPITHPSSPSRALRSPSRRTLRPARKHLYSLFSSNLTPPHRLHPLQRPPASHPPHAYQAQPLQDIHRVPNIRIDCTVRLIVQAAKKPCQEHDLPETAPQQENIEMPSRPDFAEDDALACHAGDDVPGTSRQRTRSSRSLSECQKKIK